jgi:hypothetical protein
MTGIVSFLAYVAIYVIMMTTILHTVFSLIHWLPDNVPRWIGAAVSGGPASPDQKERESAHVFAGAVNTARSGVPSGHIPKTPGKEPGGKGSEEKMEGGEGGPKNQDLFGPPN